MNRPYHGMLVLAEEEDLVELGPVVEADVEVLSRAIHIDFLVFRLLSFGRRLLWQISLRCSSFSDTDEEQVVRQELAADGGGFDGHLQEGGEGFERDLVVCIPPVDIFRSDKARCFIPAVQAVHDVAIVLNACHCFRLCEVCGECVPVVFRSKLRFTVFEANRNISVSWN